MYRGIKVFGDVKLQLEIYDATYADELVELRTSIYDVADGFLVCTPVTNRESFSNLQSWKEEINAACPNKLRK